MTARIGHGLDEPGQHANVDLDGVYVAAHRDAQIGRHMSISVTDTGIGMNEDIRRMAVEPFFTTKDAKQGTGLGLSQVYSFVRQSGGHMSIDSEPGIGTTIKLYVPIHDGADEIVPPAPVGLAAPRATMSEMILVVEDDIDVRCHAAGTLRELGYSVVEAADAASALEIIHREVGFQLLLTDLGLPGELDGRDLAALAKTLRPKLKVLLTSGYSDEAMSSERGIDAGIELLSKPFTYASLAARVREVLDAEREIPTVLVVEDDALIRMIIADALADASFKVEEAGSAREALRLLEAAEDKPRAVVLDVGLPDIRGDQLLERIRASLPTLPVILATGYGEAGLGAKVASDPHLRILSKPFDSETLERFTS